MSEYVVAVASDFGNQRGSSTRTHECLTEPTILWDMNPRRNKFRTDSWAEAVPTTPRDATVDLYIFDRSYSAFQVAGDCTVRRGLQNWNRHADNLLLIAGLAARTPYSDLCMKLRPLEA